MTTVLIEANNLSRYYDGHCAVDNVSFSLAKGEVLGFLGPNGAGKTTTMQMLCGNLAPSAGEIHINGFDLLDQPKQAKQCLGYLPDTPPLYKELTVNEYLTYCGQLHGLSLKQTQQAIELTENRCGLTQVADRLITNLSKGFQQRVGIAQAIIHNPEIIILDEPTVGLDPIQIREIRALIKELGRDHGIILSTHILSEVQESCSHVQIIKQGKLIFKETIAGLNQRMNTGSLQVRTRSTINLNLFADVNNINTIESLANNTYLFKHDINNNPTELIAEIIVGSNAGLLELTPIQQSMEEIFISLTTSKESR